MNIPVIPRKRVIIEKLTFVQLLKKFPALYCMIVSTTVCLEFLSSARSIQATTPNLISLRCRAELLLPTP
jgi:hypothetical protein